MSDATLHHFLKENENAALAAGNMAYLRHPSPEGGTDTIGYGHKLTAEEERTGKVYGFRLDQLDAEAAEAILQRDIDKHRKSLNRSLKRKHGVALDSLSPRQQAMLLDYEFNLGSAVGKFPSFTEAVLAGDEDRQKDEMIRYYTDADGNTKPLARNGNFYNTFMSTNAKKQYGE